MNFVTFITVILVLIFLFNITIILFYKLLFTNKIIVLKIA